MSDRERVNFLESLDDVYTKCNHCSSLRGEKSSERIYVQNRLRIYIQSLTNQQISEFASSMLRTCEQCDAVYPLVARILIRG